MKDTKKTIETPHLKMPKLGLGTWQLEDEDCVLSVKNALNLGYKAVDTAQIYGNEESVGKGISDSNVNRNEIFITSKVWRDQLSKKNVISSTEESLEKLNTDYIDLMLIHWPNSEYDLEETVEGFKTLKTSGKIKNYGVSNFSVSLLNKLLEIDSDFVCNQVEFHPYLDQHEILDWLLQHNKFLISYSPLARGKVLQDSNLKELSGKYNASPAQLALSWQLSKKGVLTIPKSTSADHLKSNLESLNIEISEQDMSLIDQMTKENKRLIDPDFDHSWD